MNSFHGGGLFQRASARSQGACTSARLARAHARTPASYPNSGLHHLPYEDAGTGALGVLITHETSLMQATITQTTVRDVVNAVGDAGSTRPG